MTQRVAATIGFFDGVHAGHRHVIGQLRRLAAERNMSSMVITFDRHPRQIVQDGWRPQFLTTLSRKEELLRQTGVDSVVVLHFDRAMSLLPAREFMQQVLLRQLGVSLLVMGYDNRFGRRTPGSDEGFGDYVAYGKEMGIDVVQGLPLYDADGQAVSSSAIRRMLSQGLVERASRCLGRRYSIQGTVEHGHEVGRTISFPTANICTAPDVLVPANGVYAVTVDIDDRNTPLMGVTNIGIRPTFDEDAKTIETYILDFYGDLYGHRLAINFVEHLRSERRFPSLEALAAQLSLDTSKAREILSRACPEQKQ